MKPADVFGLVVRLVGLIGIVYSLTITFLFVGTGLPLLLTIKFILAAIASLWLLRGATQLVRFAYPHLQSFAAVLAATLRMYSATRGRAPLTALSDQS